MGEIPFFLTGGSLLGALRHEGFVPHDDDIDLGCFSEDIERIRLLLPEKLACKSWGVSMWEKREFAQFAFFPDTDEQVVVDFFYRGRQEAMDPHSYLMAREVETLKEMPFCGVPMPVPADPVPYLTRVYGLLWQSHCVV